MKKKQKPINTVTVGKGVHKMPNGMMMKDSEMKKVMQMKEEMKQEKVLMKKPKSKKKGY